MLTWLTDLSHVAGIFNLFRYLTFRTLGAATTGLLLVFFFGPMIISALRLKQGKGQPIRADGPASHLLTKKGTPTMGGLMILFGLFASSLLWANLESPYVWIVLFVTAGFAAIGFYDDYLKVTKQSHLGFSGRARLAGEFLIALVACYAMMRTGGVGASSLAVPFVNGYVVDLGWAFLLFGPFVIVAFGNAVNLTDGLDGLAIVPVMIAAATLGVIAYFAGNLLYSRYLLINHIPYAGDLMVICGALIGAGVGFLWFNAPPAQIFMGDTGSLALGGLLGDDGRGDQARNRARDHRRSVRGGGAVGDRAGRLVQTDGQARLSHGADSSSFRAARLVRAADRHALLDRRLRARDGRPRDVEAEVSMTPVETFRGRKVALFGLGGSGLSTLRALAAGGAEVAAWDDDEKARARAAAAGFAPVDLTAADWRGFATLVLAPGVPLTHPKPHWTVERARAAGVGIVGDIELFARERAARAPRAPFVAVTGTNGKSTTTALIAHILRQAGRDVAMGGNIGVPILDLPPPADARVHVVECSSFQIDLAPSLAPSVGALINITPDHLDRHGTLEDYAAIKERLVARAATALIGVDDAPCRAIAARLRASEAQSGAPHVVAISAAPSLLADLWVDDQFLMARESPRDAGRSSSRARPARRAQRPERGLRFRRGAGAGPRRRGDRAWARPRSPASPIAWSKWGGSAGFCSSTIPRPPTPTPPRRRFSRSATSFGFSAARPRTAASSRCARYFRASPRPI